MDKLMERKEATKEPMVTKKTWEEFRSCRLLWFINTILHLFGWAIVLEYDENKNTIAYPARVKFRGFSEKSNSEGYEVLTQYLKDNIDDLLKEAKE